MRELAFAAELALGESVAVNGACLTVVARDAETCPLPSSAPRRCSAPTSANLRLGDRVNLERSLRLSDRLGGHLVQGHVDGVGHVAGRVRQGEWVTVWFRCPAELAAQMVPKGSVAVDGVSLTLVDVGAGPLQRGADPAHAGTRRWASSSRSGRSTWKPTCWRSTSGNACLR